jgi:hypothetical protein
VKCTAYIKTIEVQLNNRLITTPVEVRFDWDSVTAVVYAPDTNQPALVIPHEFSIVLNKSCVQLVIRSSLGSKPEVRTLYDFAQEVKPG